MILKVTSINLDKTIKYDDKINKKSNKKKVNSFKIDKFNINIPVKASDKSILDTTTNTLPNSNIISNLKKNTSLLNSSMNKNMNNRESKDTLSNYEFFD